MRPTAYGGSPCLARPTPGRTIILASAAALAALLVVPAGARAGEPAAGPEAGAAGKVPGVVKIDVEERVEGKPARETPAAYLIRKKLREAGFVAWTAKPLPIDESEKRKREKERAAAGAAAATPTADPNDERPAPDLVIKGTVDVKLGRTSTFYGQDVAYIYESAGSLAILDASGKELGRVEDGDEWGKTEKKTARDESMRRIAAWLAADVLGAEPIQARLSDAAKAAVRQYIENVESKRGRKSKEKPDPGAGDEGGKR